MKPLESLCYVPDLGGEGRELGFIVLLELRMEAPVLSRSQLDPCDGARGSSCAPDRVRNLVPLFLDFSSLVHEILQLRIVFVAPVTIKVQADGRGPESRKR